ncbi:MAG: GtrA family protein [Caulobacteraceae bacterium]|nr:GtrA family protein [Caulobacteraceae bacterium]
MTSRLAVGPFDLTALLRFGLVGLVSTLLYAALAWGATTEMRIAAAPASVLAYALAGVFSYLAQKRFTFRSNGAHKREAPRFLCASAAGASIAALAPLVLTDRLGLPPIVAIAFTCGFVPVMNYLVLERLVFRGASRPA